MPETLPINIRHIAKACHEANRVLCESTGDTTQKPWVAAPQWQQDSACEGVEWRQAHMDAPDSAQHVAWSKSKTDAGWVFGEEKDEELKTHPCLIPFDDLPPHQRAKDALFAGIAKALIPLLD